MAKSPTRGGEEARLKEQACILGQPRRDFHRTVRRSFVSLASRMNRSRPGAGKGSSAAEVATADQLEKQNEDMVGSLQSKIAAMKNVGALSHSCEPPPDLATRFLRATPRPIPRFALMLAVAQRAPLLSVIVGAGLCGSEASSIEFATVCAVR